MAYFPEGWFESEHRNVGTGTIWSDWPGSGYSPGTEVVDGSVQLSEPEYTILDNFEDSESLSYDLNSSAEQSTSISFDYAFDGDTSLLLEHDPSLTVVDWLEFDHFSFVVEDWITSVTLSDKEDGQEVYPAQANATYSSSYTFAGWRFKSDSIEIMFPNIYDDGTVQQSNVVSTITNQDTVDKWKSEPIVSHTRKDGNDDWVIKCGPLSDATDDVYLSGTLDDYTTYSGVNYNNSDGVLRLGMQGPGLDLHGDYFLKGVSP